MHRRAEAARAGARGVGRPPVPKTRQPQSALSAWWQSLVGIAPWWRIIKRLAGPLLWPLQSRWGRRIGIGLAAVAAIFVLAAGARSTFSPWRATATTWSSVSPAPRSVTVTSEG